MKTSPSSYSRTIRFLYDLQRTGIKLGLRNMRHLLRVLGNPENRFASVHIAGSNGKGSTAAMLAAALTAAGYRTGLYTSPHLISFRERIRIDGRTIPQHAIVRIVRRIKPVIRRRGMTFFEAATAIAFRYFADQKVDIAVVETGLGGRLDATNVLRPVVSVITGISLEHREMLGNTLAEIAYEKAGIIKRNGVCVCSVHNRSALRVIRNVSRKKHTRLIRVPRDRSTVQSMTLTGMEVSIGPNDRSLFVSLSGLHQAQNLATAIATLDALQNRFPHDETDREEGLKHIEEYTGFRGRLSVVAQRPLVLVDVAHNPAAMHQLTETIRRWRRKNLVVVFGVMKDKEFRPMVRSLKPLVRQAVVVQATTERARAAGDVLREFARQGIRAQTASSVADGVRTARRVARSAGTVLVTGSHFVVGEALAFLEGKKYLTINQ